MKNKIKKYLHKIDTYSMRGCYCGGKNSSWLNIVYSVFSVCLVLAVFLIIFIILNRFIGVETNNDSGSFLKGSLITLFFIAMASFVSAVVYLFINYMIWVFCGRPINKKLESLEN